MKVIISHPTGNANVRSAVSGLLDAGILSAFNTTVASFPGNLFERLGNIPPFSEFKRRSYEAAFAPYTTVSPLYELGRMAASRSGLNSLTRHEKGIFSIDAVYQQLDKQVARSLSKKIKTGIDTIYAYEDGAFFSFQEAKRLGLSCLYDLPIGYWRAARNILALERERWPEWAPTLTGFADSDEKLGRKDMELSLADRIFVASSFTAKTLNEYPGKLSPVKVIPYGFPPVVNAREYQPVNGRKLKLLFVGGLSQRKGIAYLFAAVKKLEKYVELTIVGNKPAHECQVLDHELRRHKWIPSLSHDKVLQTMRAHDVLVFPSLFEGFGLVITEAMAQGTPVITTDRTAGPDVINNDENGWLVEAGSAERLVAAIEKIITNFDLLKDTGNAAMITARQRPWSAYSTALSEAIIGNK